MSRIGNLVVQSEEIPPGELCRNCGSPSFRPSTGNDDRIRQAHGRPILDILTEGWLTCNSCGHTYYAGGSKTPKDI
jgi:hypothetical protein